MAGHIHQEVLIAAGPLEVYDWLMSAERFARLSGGAPTSIHPIAGGAFSCFGGMILGRHIELARGIRIVQAWRVRNWDVGRYSIARFELHPAPEGTRVILDHFGFPPDAERILADGWYANYWHPLQRAVLEPAPA